MKLSAICVVPDRAHAETIVTQLQASGVPNGDISVIFPHDQDTASFAKEQLDIEHPQAVAAGIGAGGFIGGTIGLLAGVGAIAIPGIGPLIAIGPILALMSGAMTGATFGAIAGSLLSLGVPEHQAKAYEQKIKAGQLLISVHSDSADEVAGARAIFESSGAHDITHTEHPHSGIAATGPES
ncbi:MAG: hypothetical protein ABI461_20905 [Polyangiaceae bacterium]